MRRWKAYLILTAAVAIQPNWSHAAEPSPFLGAWQVDVSKLPVPQPPKSVTLKVSDVGKETWRIDIDTVSQDGAVIHADARFRLDGSPAKVSGSLVVDYVSITLPNAQTLVMGTAMMGRWSNMRVFTLSDHGMRMTETITGLGPDGKPRTRTNIWRR